MLRTRKASILGPCKRLCSSAATPNITVVEARTRAQVRITASFVLLLRSDLTRHYYRSVLRRSIKHSLLHPFSMLSTVGTTICGFPSQRSATFDVCLRNKHGQSTVIIKLYRLLLYAQRRCWVEPRPEYSLGWRSHTFSISFRQLWNYEDTIDRRRADD